MIKKDQNEEKRGRRETEGETRGRRKTNKGGRRTKTKNKENDGKITRKEMELQDKRRKEERKKMVITG